ncbi:YaaC family protein [Vibrio alginolyticus]|uniref:YaaC family protein n=1 Tax=Vibrio alginolyticus TaxID=663 RepID=UPI00355C9C12
MPRRNVLNVHIYSEEGDYYALSQQIRAKGIWYFIGNSGYTMYLSKCPDHRYSQESIIYMIMFYLGSITRYHPYMFDQIFSDKEQWLMSEFLSTQPKQFLYLATANTLGQIVLKAYASF